MFAIGVVTGIVTLLLIVAGWLVLVALSPPPEEMDDGWRACPIEEGLRKKP